MAIPSIAITIIQHDDRRYFFKIMDDQGAPVDVTLFSDFIFVISNNITSPAIETKSLTGGQIIAVPPNDIYFDILTDESGSYDPGSYFCELRAISAGVHQTIGQGSVVVIDTHIGDYT